jgi:hypothetical protein
LKKNAILKSIGSKSNLDDQMSLNSNENIIRKSINDNLLTEPQNQMYARRDSELSMRRFMPGTKKLTKNNVEDSDERKSELIDIMDEKASGSDKKKGATSKLDDEKSIKRNLSLLKDRQEIGLATANPTNTFNAMMKDIEKNDFDILQQLMDQTLIYRRKIQNERCFISSKAIFKGLEYYRFLIECLPPASIPDVPFMSALLELVRF